MPDPTNKQPVPDRFKDISFDENHKPKKDIKPSAKPKATVAAPVDRFSDISFDEPVKKKDGQDTSTNTGTPSNTGTTNTVPSSSPLESLSEPAPAGGGFKSRSDEQVFSRKQNGRSNKFSFDPNGALDNALNPKKPTVSISGVPVPLDVPVPSDPQGYAKQLQDKLANKTYDQTDVDVVSKSMKVSPAAATAYMDGKVSTGTLIHFNDVKAKNQVALSNSVNQANKDLGLADSFEEVYSNLETASAYLKKIQGLYTDREKAQYEALPETGERLSSPLLMGVTGGSKGKIDADVKKVEAENRNAAQTIKAMVSNYIADKIAARPDLTKEQKVKELYRLVDPKHMEKMALDKDERLSPVRALVDYVTISDTKDAFEMLNSRKGALESQLNNKIKQRIDYNNALIGSVAESGDQATMTDEEKATITNAKTENDRLKKEYSTEKELFDKYPSLFKMQIVSKLNDFNAIKSGNVEGEKGYEGMDENEFLKMEGYDLENQVTADAVNWAKDHTKDYSYFGSPKKEAIDVFLNAGKSIGDILQLRDEATRDAEDISAELFPNRVGENDQYQLKGGFFGAKNMQNISNTTGQVIGQAAFQYGTAGLGRMAGLSKLAAMETAFYISGALPSYDQAYKDSGDFIENKSGRVLYAALIALSNAVSEKMFPDVKIFQIPGVKDQLAALASKAGTKEFTSELTDQALGKVKNAIVQYSKHFSKNVAEETAEEVSTQWFEDASRFIAGDPNASIEKAIENTKNTAYQTATGMLAIGLYGAHKDVRGEKNVAAKATLYNAALYPDEAMDAINEGFRQKLYDQAERDEKIKTVNTAIAAKAITEKTEKIYGKSLKRPERELYVANLTAEALLKDQIKDAGEDEDVKKGLEEKIFNLRQQRQQILKGEARIDDFGDVVDGKPVYKFNGKEIGKGEFLIRMNSKNVDDYDLEVTNDDAVQKALRNIGGKDISSLNTNKNGKVNSENGKSGTKAKGGEEVSQANQNAGDASGSSNEQGAEKVTATGAAGDNTAAPLPKQKPARYGPNDITPAEQTAIDGFEGKKFEGSIKNWTDVIQNNESSPAEKKQALKELGEQLSDPESEIAIGMALGTSAEGIYDLISSPKTTSDGKSKEGSQKTGSEKGRQEDVLNSDDNTGPDKTGSVSSTVGEVPTDFEELAEPVLSAHDAQVRWSNGERIFRVGEQSETPTEITSLEELDKSSQEQLFAYPNAENVYNNDGSLKQENKPIQNEPVKEEPVSAVSSEVGGVGAGGDVKVQGSEYKGVTGTTSVNVKEKDGIIKATFKGTRSDKPNATIGASGYRYGGKAVKETLSDFEKDYGVKVDEIIDGVDIAEITVLEERAEVNPRQGVGTKQSVTLRIRDTDGNIINDVNIVVNKRKFTEQPKSENKPIQNEPASSTTVSSGVVDKAYNVGGDVEQNLLDNYSNQGRDESSKKVVQKDGTVLDKLDGVVYSVTEPTKGADGKVDKNLRQIIPTNDKSLDGQPLWKDMSNTSEVPDIRVVTKENAPPKPKPSDFSDLPEKERYKAYSEATEKWENDYTEKKQVGTKKQTTQIQSPVFDYDPEYKGQTKEEVGYKKIKSVEQSLSKQESVEQPKTENKPIQKDPGAAAPLDEKLKKARESVAQQPAAEEKPVTEKIGKPSRQKVAPVEKIVPVVNNIEDEIDKAGKAKNNPEQQDKYKILANGPYQKAIADGEMTATDAKNILESAEVEVPNDILQLASKEQQPETKPSKPVKGDKVFDSKKNVEATVTRVFTPAKGSALENEPFLMDLKYDNGKGKAINMPMGDRFTLVQSENKNAESNIAKPGDLKGVTEIEYEDNGDTLLYGTKSNKTRISVKGMTADEIKNEIDFEKKVLDKSKRDVASFDESEVMSAKGMTRDEKEQSIKMNKQSVLVNEQTEKIVIPFYEKKLKELSADKKVVVQKKMITLAGAKNTFDQNTRQFIGWLNSYPLSYVGTDVIEGKGGVTFNFYNEDNKTDNKYFVKGNPDVMIPAVENFVNEIRNQNEKQSEDTKGTGEEGSTAAILSTAKTVISKAKAAATEKEVDEAVSNIEQTINDVVSKIGKLTEVYSTDDINHERPNVVIGKAAKKEITKYAKEIARLTGWAIPEKNGIYDNIAPAGGDVAFHFNIPGTTYQMYVSAKYEPEYNNDYDNYTFNGFFYRLENLNPEKGQSQFIGGNQWQRENIAAKEMAEILKKEADRYATSSPTTSEIKSITTAEPAKRFTQKLSEQANKELGDLWDDLNDLVNKQGITPDSEAEVKKGIVASKIIAKATEAGIYKLADIVAMGLDRLGAAFDTIVPYVKKAYLAFQTDASDDVLEKMDSVADVRKFDYETFKNTDNGTNSGPTDVSTTSLGNGSEKLAADGASSDVQPNESRGATGKLAGEESGGSAADATKTGKPADESATGRGNSEGQSSISVTGNNKVDAQLGGESKKQEIPEPVEDTPVVYPLQHNGNFVIPPDFTNAKSFNVAQKLQDNINALKVLVTLKNEGRKATYEEQQTLFKYVGWGGIKEIGFDPDSNNGWVASNESLKPKIKEVLSVLKELDEYGYDDNLSSIKSSTLNAHYTAVPIIRGMWNVIRKAGFKKGTVLEPSAGVGHFLGAMPIDMKEESQLAAIEKDNITSLILQGLYPNIITKKATGYEEVRFAPNTVDLIISNIPFGDYAVYDPNFARSKDKSLKNSQRKIHSYFFARAINDAKPNGLVAFITSTGILDSKDNADLRKMMAAKSEFLGAVRIPSDAFKGNANTQVTTDIIFLRKFGIDEEAEQRHTFQNLKKKNVKHKNNDQKFDVTYNEYFHNNPEMILGDIQAGSMYGASRDGINDAMTVSSNGIDLEKKITELADKIFSSEIVDNTEQLKTKEAANSFIKNNGERAGNIVLTTTGFGTFTDDIHIDPTLDEKAWEIGINPNNIRLGELYEEDYDKLKAAGLSVADFQMNQVTPIKVAKKYQTAVPDFIAVRSALNQLYAAEYGDLGNNIIEHKRTDLNNAYKAFVKNNGTLFENKALLELDRADGHNISALENVEDKKVISLADIFTKRVFSPQTKAESAADISDAISLNLSETGDIDIDRLAELLKTTPEEIIKLGDGIIYKNPSGHFETSDKYLSGDVRKKLEEAKIAAKTDKFYEQNVTALEAAQPKDLSASQIYAPISAPWINKKYIEEFASHLFKQNININKLSTGRVNVDGRVSNTEVTDVYGTSRRDGFELFEEAMQNRMPIVHDVIKNGDSTRTVINEQATQQAVEKAEKIKKAFEQWIWQDDTRRNDLVNYYNQHFNNVVIRKYNGSHLKFEGYAGKHTPMQHQMDGVWMISQQMGGILDHIVGSGKSLLMALAANKMKKMGLIKKPIIIGLKANAEDLARAYKDSFPLAKVLYPRAKDFTVDNRKAFFAKMANNDWDAIVMTHDQFGMIEQSKEIQEEIMNQEIESLENDIRSAKDNNMSKRDLNGLEKRKQNLEAKLKDLSAMKKDPSLKSFEEMGIDFMFVDESQQFKNLQYSTIQKGVAGLGDPLGSAKAFNMLFAIRTLQKKWGGDKGVVFASGTPISNTMVEMYLLFKYLRANKMAEMGINSFDQWANTFAYVGSEIEFGVTNSLKPKTRMREFRNVPEMATMYREIADVRNDSNLSLKKPKFKQTFRLKTDKKIANGEIVTIGDRKFKSIGNIRGLEKNEFYISLMSMGPDDKIPTSGDINYEGGTVKYSEVSYNDGLLVNISPTKEQRKFAKAIQKFAETKDGRYIGQPNLSDKKKKAYMLLATNLASKMAIDMRLIDPSYAGSEIGKLGKVADSILDHYKESDSKKGIQLVFSDLGTPKTQNTAENLYDLLESRGVDTDTLENIFGEGAKAEKPRFPKMDKLKEKIMQVMEYSEEQFEDAVIEANEDTFNVYQDIKNKLVKRGIPSNEIAFIHDYKTDLQRKTLFEDARSGKIRVIIGSTSKLGTGVNVQNKIVAMHHIDVPWRPSDMEQRNGRGIRQGNEIIREHYNNELPIYYYATEATLDAYKYQLLDTKQKFIDQGKTGDGGAREISEGEGDEENGVSYAAIVAMLSGNPVILEKAKIDKVVKELESSAASFEQDKYSLKDKIGRNKNWANYNQTQINELEKDKALFDANSTKNEKTGELVYNINIQGENFTERKKAGEKLIEIRDEFASAYKLRHADHRKWTKFSNIPEDQKTIGKLAGFDVFIRMDGYYYDGKVQLSPAIGISNPASQTKFGTSNSSDPVSLAGHLQREVRDLQPTIDKLQREIREYDKDSKDKQQYLESLPATFPKQKDLDAALERQKKVEAALKEMVNTKLPSEDDLIELGERMRDINKLQDLAENDDLEEENIYAITENGEISRIKTADEFYAAAEDKATRFYKYEEDTLEPENPTDPTDEPGDDKFSAGEWAGEFETKDATPVSLEKLKAKYPDAVIVESKYELPAKVLQEAQDRGVTSIEGVFHNGVVYLVADNLENMGRAEAVYKHETIGHSGVIGVLKDKLNPFMEGLVNNATDLQKKQIDKLSQRIFKKDSAELTQAEKIVLGEEYVAQAAENISKYPTTWQKVSAFVRSALRDLGFKIAVSDNDIKVLLARASSARGFANGTRFSGNYLQDLLNKVRDDISMQEPVTIAPDLKKYGDEMIDWVKQDNSGATYNDVVAELNSEVGNQFTEAEKEPLYRYIRQKMAGKYVEPSTQQSQPAAVPQEPTGGDNGNGGNTGRRPSQVPAEGAGMTHADTAETRQEFNLPDYEKQAGTFQEWDEQARQRIADGKMQDVLDNLKMGFGLRDEVEQRMMGMYLAHLSDIAGETGANEDIRNLYEAIKLSDRVGGSVAAKILTARKGLFDNDASLAGYWAREMEATHVDELTDEQMQLNKQEFEDRQQADKDYEKELAKLKKQVAKWKAKAKLKEEKEKAERKASEKKKQSEPKTHEQLVIEKEKLTTSIKDKLRQARERKANPGIKKQNATAPGFSPAPAPNTNPKLDKAEALALVDDDMQDYIRTLVDDDNSIGLDEVQQSLFDILEEDVDGLTMDDVTNVIAGDYTKAKRPLTDLQKMVREIKEEAKLVKKLKDLLDGKIPDKPEKKKELNKNIAALRKQIADIRKNIPDNEKRLQNYIDRIKKQADKVEEKLSNNDLSTDQRSPFLDDPALKAEFPELFDEAVSEKERLTKMNKKMQELRKELPYDEKDLQRYIDRQNKEAERIQAKIDAGDYSTDKKKPSMMEDADVRTNFPEQYKKALEAKDRVIKIKIDREVRLMKEELKNRKWWQKKKDDALELLNMPRTLMSSVDFSAPLRQGIIPTITHPSMAFGIKVVNDKLVYHGAFWQMFKYAFNKKDFDRWFHDLKESPNFQLMQKAGLYVADPHNHKLMAKEEMFMNNAAEKLPFLGRLVSGSERAYVGYLNKMRVDLFMQGVDLLESRQKYIETDLEDYQALAKWVGNSTGRGNMIDVMKKASPLLNATFFSPRLISSRLNLLNPVNYVQVFRKSPEVGKMMLGDMAKFVTFGLSVLAMASLNSDCENGEDKSGNPCGVEVDPRSTDFGKIRSINTRYDIWGGFQQYVRVIAQLYSGKAKSTSTGEIINISGEEDPEYRSYFGTDRSTVIGKFVRGKFAPIPSLITDLVQRRTGMGDKINMRVHAPIPGTTWGGELPDKPGEMDLTDRTMQMIAPLVAQDLYKAWQDNGVKSLYTTLLPATFGLSVQTYDKKK